MPIWRIVAIVFVVVALTSTAFGQQPHLNLLFNPGFETVIGGGPSGWNAQGNAWGSDSIKFGEEAARTGNVGVRLSGDTYIQQRLEGGVEPGATYEMSAWQRGVGPGPAAFKYEFFDQNRRSTGEYTHTFTPSTDWERVAFVAEAPEGTVGVRVYFRHRGNDGWIDYDDASLVKIAGGVAEAADEREWHDPDKVAAVARGELREANVAWWGFDPEDSTEYIQAAINSGAPTVIIPNVGQDWIVRPLFLRSHLELILEEGVVVTAKKGEFHGRTDSLLSGRDIENLVIKGYGATLRMQKDDYADPTKYEKAEWRMGIELRGSKNVGIYGLTIRDTGGDGIYLGRGTRMIHNEDVIIKDVIADNNYRQGMSVISARNLLVEDSVFKNTGGTAPQAGIDLEPNRPDELLENIVIRNSVFENNTGAGITMYTNNMNQSSAPISVVWENLLIRDNTFGVRFTFADAAADPTNVPAGEIIVRNCVIEQSRNNGIQLRHKSETSLHVHFEDCILMQHVDTEEFTPRFRSGTPIHFQAHDTVAGVSFSEVSVIDMLDRPVIHGQLQNAEAEGRFEKISGDLFVLNPFSAQSLWEGELRDVSLNIVDIESVDVDYNKVIDVPGYDLESFSLERPPRIRISNQSSDGFDQAIRGVFVPEVQLLNFPVGDVSKVEASLNGELVYSAVGPVVSGSFAIDTTELDDLRHDLHVKVLRNSGPPVETMVAFSTRNYVLRHDPFEGPREVAWFGQVYNPVVISQSSGWTYVTDRPNDFFGDPHRKVRPENTTEYLIWEMPGLKDFEMDLYASENFGDGILVIEGTTDASYDEGRWHPLNYEVERIDTAAAGWLHFKLRSSADESIRFVRLTMPESDWAGQIQLGHAIFRLKREE